MNAYIQKPFLKFFINTKTTAPRTVISTTSLHGLNIHIKRRVFNDS